MISIIIPLYNKRQTIAKTINSILNQTYKDLEIIVIDDGSGDGSIEEAEKFGKKITLIKGLGHFGANWARNYGAHLAGGDYLFFCDADIVLWPDALQKLKKALDENPSASYAYCSFVRGGWKKMPSRKFDAELLKKYNYISTMSLLRRADFAGFDENLKRFQDWDLWLTMAEKRKAGIFVPEFLFSSYVARNSISQWLPKIFYRIPWLKAVKKYNEAREIILKKHNL